MSAKKKLPDLPPDWFCDDQENLLDLLDEPPEQAPPQDRE